MRLMATALAQTGVTVLTKPVRKTDLHQFKSAFAASSIRPDQPLASIDEVQLLDDQRLREALATAIRAIPWEEI